MKKINVLLFLFLLWGTSSFAAKKEAPNGILISNWLKSGGIELQYPAFHNTKDVEDKIFGAKELLQESYLNLEKLRPQANEELKWNKKKFVWETISTNKKGFVNLENSGQPELTYLVSYISTEEFLKAKLEIESTSMYEVYLDGKKIVSNFQKEEKKPSKKESSLKLVNGKHTLLFKLLSTGDKNALKVKLSPNKDWSKSDLQLSLSPKHFITINSVLDGTKVKGVQISSDGNYAILSYSRTLPPSDKNEYWKEIQDLKTGKIIHTFKDSKLGQIKWHPNSFAISYTRKLNGTTNLYKFDLDKGHESLVGENIADFSSYNWAPNGNFIVYTVSKDYSEEWKIRKIQGMEDRLPWFRNRSFLYKLNVESGIKQRLSFGAISTSLHDISPDGKHILFSQSRPDYKEYPYDKQNLYLMDVNNLSIDTIWKDKLFSGSAQFSPNGKQLLVQGGPSCFGKTGENIGKQALANNYDGQLYILDLNSKKVDPITYNFDPSVNSAKWNRKNGIVYINAADKDYVKLYSYNTNSKDFKLIPTGADVIKGIDFSTNSNQIVYIGCGISSPYKAFVMDLSSKKFKPISNPEKEKFKDVEFGKTEDWNFTKTDGKTIIGRVYYPPNFDPNKKYPLIVNYYAGTSPVERSFGGRYPLNLYAANGYIVYLLQPSGAIGFGQEFSAEHQNNWGKTTADEIIEGTKKFLSAHPFVDSEKVGCIGASYGGFMTMYLQTQTDIFAAAISHAGISSISSYWGEGYWGYSYSVNASGHSFPWNNKDLYIKQSPLFNADKVSTPILLIHGSVDTNVPPGESIQMYQALKLLGKDAELVMVKNQDHHILNYTQRILWNNTIFAYFNKYLKNQPAWWNELYPDKNL